MCVCFVNRLAREVTYEHSTGGSDGLGELGPQTDCRELRNHKLRVNSAEMS